MAEPFLGSIIIFGGNFAPRGWAFCNGQILAISQNTALFSLLGTTYGGNGQTTFALPDLRGRVPIHFGQGPGLSNYSEGETGGAESVTLSAAQMPQHQHVQPASNGDEDTNRPNNAVPAHGGVYATTTDGSALDPTSAAGGSQPHENRPPYLAINYIIALEGIFPSRN
jgi:microcystin-dependent protein